MINERLLEYLKTADDYVSGEKLGEILGVSRSAVWKEISALRQAGYEIVAVTNRGYKINSVGDIINSAEIRTNGLIGKKIVCFDKVESTNEVCKKLYFENAEEGTVVIADTQSTGRGRLGRNWTSKPKSGVYMSILLKPDINPAKLSSVTLCAGLAVCTALKEDFGINAGIKWPNDIVVDGKKICGILTEMSGQMQKVDFVVVGIGINVNNESFPEEIQHKASSLYLLSGKKFKRSSIAKAVLNRFDKIYNIFEKEGFKPFKEEYETNCINIGKKVRVIKHGDESYEALAVGINDDGELTVKKDNGEITDVFSGEVSIRGVY